MLSLSRSAALAGAACGAALATLGLVGCGTAVHPRETTITKAPSPSSSAYREPRRLVLTAPGSIPGYELNRSGSGPLTNEMAAKSGNPATRNQIVGTGRITGYGTSWYPAGRAGSTAQIASSASTFATDSGARRAFVLGVEALRRSYSTIAVTPTIGSRSHVFTIQMDGPVDSLTLILIAWQYERVVATLVATGDSDTFNADVAIGLARRQQRQIARALAHAP